MALKRWLGTAADIQQVQTITVANTWAGADTATCTINGNDVVVTVGTGTATTAVAEAISNALNASGRLDNLESDESRNVGGQEIPEFREITASVSGSVVTVTVDQPGRPVTMTVTESTAGTGTATLATSQAATGKNFLDNVDNWSGGALPGAADEVYFSDNNVSILFALDQLPDGTVIDEWHVLASYTGQIGLADVNDFDTTSPYQEYRPRRLLIPNDAAGDSDVFIGAGQGFGTTRARFEWAGSTGEIIAMVYKTAPVAVGMYAADFQISATSGSNASKARVFGNATCSFNTDQEGTAGTLDELVVGEAGQPGNPAVHVGPTLTLGSVAGTDTVIYSGVLYLFGACAQDLQVFGGRCQVSNTITGDLSISNGICELFDTKGVAPSAIRVSGTGELHADDLQQSLSAAPLLYAGSGFSDPRKNITGVVDLWECGVEDLKFLRIGKHTRLTRTLGIP